MTGPDPSPVIIDAKGRFSFAAREGAEAASGEARVRLHDEYLAVAPQFGEPLRLPLRDMLEVVGAGHRVELRLSSDEVLSLSHLGYAYEDFLRLLRRARGEVLLRDLLMHENLQKAGVTAAARLTGPEGGVRLSGRCELRIYDTGLVILPESDPPLRIPLGEVEEVRRRDHSLAVVTEDGETLELSKLGRELDPFARDLSEAMGRLGLLAQASLHELLPLADPSVIRRAARFLRDGKAARRLDVESVSPDLWAQLEGMLERAGIREEYEFLASRSLRDRLCIGVKRGLVGGPAGDYVWFLAPIPCAEGDRERRVMAMEAGVLGAPGGRATYFFRIGDGTGVAAGEVPAVCGDAGVDAAIRHLNRALVAVNFRREPIYLPATRLREPQYLKYHFAVEAIPELRRLRRLFVGRVVHRSQSQWRDDVLDLLRFAAAGEEGEQWRRGVGLDGPDEVFADESAGSRDESAPNLDASHLKPDE